MIQAQHNDQKHSLYLHTSGGKNAIEKCLWYKVTFKFKNGKAIMKRIYEESGILKTKSSHSSKPEIVPRYEVDQSHKTLGCWVNPIMNQRKQKEDDEFAERERREWEEAESERKALVAEA